MSIDGSGDDHPPFDLVVDLFGPAATSRRITQRDTDLAFGLADLQAHLHAPLEILHRSVPLDRV
jgi:hypothetical protein